MCGRNDTAQRSAERGDVRSWHRDQYLRRLIEHERVRSDALHCVETKLQRLDAGRPLEVDHERWMRAIAARLGPPVCDRRTRSRSGIERKPVTDRICEQANVRVIGPV